MARIDVKWSEPTLNTYDKINTADFFTALPADFKADGKPLLIYVTSTKDEDKIETREAALKRKWTEERVAKS